jgi:hypothetical protein
MGQWRFAEIFCQPEDEHLSRGGKNASANIADDLDF